MRTSFTHVTARTTGCFVVFLLLVWPHTASAVTYLSIETVPNRDVVGEDVVVAIRSIGYANLERWSQRLLGECRVVDSVIDALKANAAISAITSTNTRAVVAAGGFEGGTNPSFVLTVKDSGADSVTEVDVDVLGNALGYVQSQGSTAHFSPDNFKAYAFPLDYILVTFSGPLSGAEAQAFFEHLGTIDPALFSGLFAGFTQIDRPGSLMNNSMLFLQQHRRADDGASRRRVSRKRLDHVPGRGSVSGERRRIPSATARACRAPGTTSGRRRSLAGSDRRGRRRGVPRHTVHVPELERHSERHIEPRLTAADRSQTLEGHANTRADAERQQRKQIDVARQFGAG
jgi:hypothetical protein